MSVPVRYSAAAVSHKNNTCTGDRSAESAEVRWQRITEGRLTTPDAAAASISHSTDQQQNQQQPQAPIPSTEVLFAKLHEALALEAKFQPALYLPKESHVS